LFTGCQIVFQTHPGAGPAVEIPAIVFEAVTRCDGGAVYFGTLARLSQNGGVFLTQRAACLIATHFLY
jgi:hypothetical protein